MKAVMLTGRAWIRTTRDKHCPTVPTCSSLGLLKAPRCVLSTWLTSGTVRHGTLYCIALEATMGGSCQRCRASGSTAWLT